MELIRLLTELTTYPLYYLLWWLFFSWFLWLLLKWRKWRRPTISIMLICSTAVGIFFINSLKQVERCIELCLPSFSLFPFIAAVSFWYIVLYVPIVLASKTQSVSEQIRRNRWIALLMLILAVWHVSAGLGGIIGSLENYDFTASDIFSDIFFYPAMGILLPWLFWLLLTFFPWNRLTLPTMFIYSISLASASVRLWFSALSYRRSSGGFFSLSLFLAEVAMWFITLYVLMKLTVRIERHVIN